MNRASAAPKENQSDRVRAVNWAVRVRFGLSTAANTVAVVLAVVLASAAAPQIERCGARSVNMSADPTAVR